MAYWGYLIDYKPYKGVPFSPELWRQAGEHMKSQDRSLGDVLYGISPRCGMYDDLKTNYLKKGMHISEVEKLFGELDWISYCMDKKIKCASFILGKCYANALTISHNDLHVCFDHNQKIIEVGKNRTHRELCNGNIISCIENEEKCDCYKNDDAMGKECDFKVDKW